MEQEKQDADIFSEGLIVELPTEGDVALKFIEAEAMALAATVQQISPKVCIAKLEDGYEVDYERTFQPLCRVCNCEHRNEAEYVFLMNNHNAKAVERWSDDNDYNLKYESIANHMKNHCAFDKRSIDFIGKLQTREKDLAKTRVDPLRFCGDVVTNALFELGSFDLSGDPKMAASVAAIMIQGVRAMATIEQTREKIGGSMARAQRMVDAKNDRIEKLLDALMTVASDEQKPLILSALREFQRDGGV